MKQTENVIVSIWALKYAVDSGILEAVWGYCIRTFSCRSAIKVKTSLIEEAHSTKNASDLLKRAYEISQGVKVKEVPLDDLAKSWAKVPRSRAITERHEMECMRRLNKFVEFIQKNSTALFVFQVMMCNLWRNLR